MPNIWIRCSKSETSPPPWDVRAAEDSAHVVEFLISGAYADDDALFSGFVIWTDDIVAARGVPATTLFPTLDLVGKHLHEVPCCRRLPLAAGSALADEKSSATDPQLKP
jgi:hypothetical protein